MLVLSRKPGQRVLIGSTINVSVVEVQGNRVRLGFDVPDDVRILRSELASRLEQRPPIDYTGIGNHHQLAGPEPPHYSNEWELAGNDPTAAGDDHLHFTVVSSAARLPPKTEQTGTVKIITFTAGQVRQENVIATELDGLTDNLADCHLLLDFTNVEYITSVELETLLSLHKKMEASGGRLTLFNLNFQVFEVFTVAHLENLMGICR